MKTTARLWMPVALFALLATTGCVKLWQKRIDIRTYMIEARREGEPRETRGGKLWVDSVGVLPPYDGRNLVLRESDVEFATSYYTELLMSPGENLRNEIFAWFADSGLFADVSVLDRDARTHSLQATIMELHGDKPAGKAVMRVRATLLDEKTRADRVLFSRDYERRVEVAEPSAEVLIRAYNQALAEILADMEADAAEALSARYEGINHG